MFIRYITACYWGHCCPAENLNLSVAKSRAAAQLPGCPGDVLKSKGSGASRSIATAGSSRRNREQGVQKVGQWLARGNDVVQTSHLSLSRDEMRVWGPSKGFRVPGFRKARSETHPSWYGSRVWECTWPSVFLCLTFCYYRVLLICYWWSFPIGGLENSLFHWLMRSQCPFVSESKFCVAYRLLWSSLPFWCIYIEETCPILLFS